MWKIPIPVLADFLKPREVVALGQTSRNYNSRWLHLASCTWKIFLQRDFPIGALLATTISPAKVVQIYVFPESQSAADCRKHALVYIKDRVLFHLKAVAKGCVESFHDLCDMVDVDWILQLVLRVPPSSSLFYLRFAQRAHSRGDNALEQKLLELGGQVGEKESLLEDTKIRLSNVFREEKTAMLFSQIGVTVENISVFLKIWPILQPQKEFLFNEWTQIQHVLERLDQTRAFARCIWICEQLVSFALSSLQQAEIYEREIVYSLFAHDWHGLKKRLRDSDDRKWIVDWYLGEDPHDFSLPVHLSQDTARYVARFHAKNGDIARAQTLLRNRLGRPIQPRANDEGFTMAPLFVLENCRLRLLHGFDQTYAIRDFASLLDTDPSLWHPDFCEFWLCFDIDLLFWEVQSLVQAHQKTFEQNCKRVRRASFPV